MEELPNLHGATAHACQLCGECDVGCNYGAKNTLDYNYLTHAQHHGAEIRTLSDVRRFEPREGGGYAVDYAALTARARAPADALARPTSRALTCDHLMLSAGTLGTTNLLLRNRSAFPRLCRRLGTRFCGNGDLLTLVAATGRRRRRGSSIPATARLSRPPRACPTRSTAARAAASTCRTRAIPQHLAWILHVIAAPKSLWAGARAPRTWSRTGCGARPTPTSPATSPT